MKKQQLIIIFSLFIAIITNPSCVKEEFDPGKISQDLQLDAALAVPVGYTTMTLERYLADSVRPEQLIIDDDGFITLMYHKHVFSYKASSIIQLPAVSENYAIQNINQDINFSTITDDMEYTDTMTFDIGFVQDASERLDSIYLSTGKLAIKANLLKNLNAELKVTIPNIKKNGTPYSATLDLNGNISEKKLDDYILGTTSGETPNQVQVIYTLTVSQSDVTVAANEDLVKIDFSLSDLDYSAIFGYIGQHEINIPLTTFRFNFYDNIVDGTFHFKEPKLNILINNSFGVPVQLYMEEFYATTRDGDEVTLTGEQIPTDANPKIINYPALTQVGETVSDNIYLDGQNTNLFTVLEQAPQSAAYAVNGLTNPDGVDKNNFITKDSRYDVDVQFELPVWGYADFLLMVDTLRFNLDDILNQDIEQIKKLVFRLYTKNSFPVTIKAQAYFADAQYNVLDSLFNDSRLISAGVDSNGDGKTETTENESFNVEFDRDKVQNIDDAEYLLIYGRIQTTNADATPPENVKFYADYSLYAHLGVIAEVVGSPSDIEDLK